MYISKHITTISSKKRIHVILLINLRYFFFCTRNREVMASQTLLESISDGNLPESKEE